MRRPSNEALITGAVVALSAGFVFTRLEPSLIFANTTPAGGDMGAQVWAPAFMRDHLLPHGRISGWAPDWYAGFPAFAFYFPLPSFLIVLLDLLFPYGVAFKLVSVLGPVTLPIAAYAFGRLSGLRFPGPPLLAVATLPFLFDSSFTIYGGNIASMLAGEFAFSVSLSFALLFLGVMSRGLETGRYRALAAILFALTVLSHLIPAIFATGAALLLLVFRLDRHRIRYFIAVVVFAGLLVSFWALPLVARLDYANDMGWQKITEYGKTLFPTHMKWVLPLSAAGVIGAIGLRLFSGVSIAAIGALAGIGFLVAPEGRLWNARLLPFWFLCLYLLAGIGVAELGRALGGVFTRDPDRPPSWPSLATPVLGLIATILVVGGPLSALPQWLPIRPGQASFVPDWVRWNFSGYERKATYPEYRSVIERMGRLPCGRAMWEYGPELNRYGTPMALMLLPYWTDGCIASMEGLYFESTPTVPFHFIIQSELSRNPSNPQRDLPYPGLNPAQGVKHLQLLGVRYYMATSPETIAHARAHPDLRHVATSVPWEIFEVAKASLVEALDYEPVVINEVGQGQDEWLPLALDFYMNPDDWDVFLSADGPERWARVHPGRAPPRRHVKAVQVTKIRSSDDRLSFDVDKPGSPVLVKTSYFPNWKVKGADGPWRVTPNLMVVVPSSRHVELYYGYTLVDIVGWLFTILGLFSVALVARRTLHLPPAPGVERFRRFASITAAVTAIDYIVLLLLRQQFGVPLIVADAFSIAIAATVSYSLHRSITFAGDPHVRWVGSPATFASVAAVAGLVDLLVLWASVALFDSTSTLSLIVAKTLAVGVAGGFRFAAYRGLLFATVREEQSVPAMRPIAEGGLRLSVVIPAFNQEEQIGETLMSIRRELYPLGAEGGFETIVVDDGSTDETASIARASLADHVLVLNANRGKGAALRTGVLSARGRTVAFLDADLSYSPDQLLVLLRKIEAGWDVAVGSRKHTKTSTLIRAGRLREVSGRLFNALTRALLLGQYRDTQCGLKAFRSDVARLLFNRSRLDRFAFDVELFHLAERYRLSLTEVPVTVAHSETSSVRVVMDSLRMIRDVFLIRRWGGEGVYDLTADDEALVFPRRDAVGLIQREGPLAVTNVHEESSPLLKVRLVPDKLRQDPHLVALAALIGVWSAVFMYLGWRQHVRFATLSFDTGIYDQAVWLLSRFKDPFITVRGLNFFGHHVNPLLLLLVPFYWLGAGPVFLIFVQVVAQAAGAVAIYLLARKRLADRWLAVVLGGVLLLHPSWQWQVWWYFHPEVLGAAALLFAYWAADSKRWPWFWVATAVAVASKEEVALAAMLLGLLVAIRGEWRKGLATGGLSLAWFLVGIEFILPAVNNGLTPWYFGFFGEFGSSPLGVAFNIVRHPIKAMKVVLASDRLDYLRMMFAPVSFLAFVRPLVLLIAVPMLAVNLFSTIGYHRQIKYQYSALVVAVIALASVEAIGLLGRSVGIRRFLVGLIAATSLAATIAWGPSPLGSQFPGLWPLGDDPRLESKQAAVSMVPSDAPVSAAYYLVPHLTHRTKIYDFPAPWTAANWGIKGENLDDPSDVQWLVLDREVLGEESRALLGRLLAKEFDVRFERSGILVAERVVRRKGSA